MNLRFYNGKILTGGADSPFALAQGELHIRGSRIAAIGPQADTDAVWDREIDLHGDLVLPGFKNAHTHSAMTFLRSNADDMPLESWLTEQVFPYEAKLTPDDIYILSKLAIAEYLTSGITANFDMYLMPEPAAAASAACGFRTVLTGAVNDFTQSVRQLEDWYHTLNRLDPLISFLPGFHAEYTAAYALLKELGQLARSLKAPFYMHNAETPREVAACRERYGKTPSLLFEELGIFDYGGGGFHCIYLSEPDLEVFQRHDISAVTCPAANLKLASGIAPVGSLLAHGINVAIGTDGPAGNNALDLFREMYLISVLAKHRSFDAAALDAEQVLRMACAGGAKAMRLAEADCLAEGKLADLTVLSLNGPNMRPVNHPLKNIVYAGSKLNVRMTVVNGRILYEDGEFYIGEDIGKIYENAAAVTKRLLR
ncbi:MAG: amidohydrolase [Clostridia bacterium]